MIEEKEMEAIVDSLMEAALVEPDGHCHALVNPLGDTRRCANHTRAESLYCSVHMPYRKGAEQ